MSRYALEHGQLPPDFWFACLIAAGIGGLIGLAIALYVNK